MNTLKKFLKAALIVPVLAAGITFVPTQASAYPMYQLAPKAREGAAVRGFSQGSTSRSGAWISAIGIGIMMMLMW